MRVTTLILIILFIVSCKYRLENKKVEVDEKVTEWSSSDEPPSTELCDKFVSEEDRINCFKTELSAIIFEQIDFSEVKVKIPLDDTLKISIMIDKSGKVSYLNSNINTNVEPYYENNKFRLFFIWLIVCSISSNKFSFR